MYSKAEATHEELLWNPFPNVISIPVVARINHDNNTATVNGIPCCPKCLEPYRIFPEPGTVCINSTREDYLE